jgi:hypothetical protein
MLAVKAHERDRSALHGVAISRVPMVASTIGIECERGGPSVDL